MTNMTKSMWVNLTHRNNMTSEGTMLESKIRSLVYAKRDLAEVGDDVILNEEFIIDMHYPRAYRLINDIVDIANKLLEAGKIYMKVYRQMKMYNDPSTNPILYQNKK